ncbi:hypothetical protein LX83_006071 [Goodfellowiella coeruleoviolacea]|uniref:DUF5753 domain-containing protein n=1 Tax=Goodfellowiella coeruleoviolacea TaxID=334858 RepID=A0AAE3GJ58_9PSEU|nr:hypothetical protein [Goodfellowiella coeruleoviolacea]
MLREQLELIYELASLPHVTIQVIPFSAGAHASHGVSFTILNFTEHRLGIVYNEGLTGSDYLSREHTRIYSLAFNSLCSAAATPETTMELVARRIADLGA